MKKNTGAKWLFISALFILVCMMNVKTWSNASATKEVFSVIDTVEKYAIKVDTFQVTPKVKLWFYHPVNYDAGAPIDLTAPGGGFTSNNHKEVITMCNHKAKAGIPCWRMSYRTSPLNLFNPEPLLHTDWCVYRTAEDIRMCIRMIKDLNQKKKLGLDTSVVYGTGLSAGAMGMLAVAYNYQINYPKYKQTKLPHYGSGITKFCSMWGAVLNLNIVKNVPGLFIHGTMDQILPYTEGTAFSSVYVFGSKAIMNYYEQNGWIVHCKSDLYKKRVYPNIKITHDVVYGQNTNYTGQSQNLLMDIYEPDDAGINYYRPLIIDEHGGAFTMGSKTAANQVAFADSMAHLGYVVALLDYRIGMPNPLSKSDNEVAIYRAVQDMLCGDRFFREKREFYKIDTAHIFNAGTSAGAIASLYSQYWNVNEFPSSIDTSVLHSLWNAGGHSGFSNKVKAILSFWGAVLDTNIFNGGANVPVNSFQTTGDPTIPYISGLYYNTNFTIYGCYTVNRVLQSLNIQSQLSPYNITGHGVAPGTAGWDSCVRSMQAFAYSQLDFTGCRQGVQLNTWTNYNHGLTAHYNSDGSQIPTDPTKNLIIATNQSILFLYK